MSKAKKFIGYLPAIFVVLISAAAFVPGFLVSGVKENVETAQGYMDEAQITFDYMVEQGNFVYEYDSNIYTLMWQKLQECRELEIEWITLGSNATELQNNTFVGLLLANFGVVNVLAQQTFSFYIDTDFSNDPDQLRYELGEASTGQVYAIDREDWEDNPVFLRTTLEDFLTITYAAWYDVGHGFFQNDTMDFLLANHSEALEGTFNFLYAEDTLFTLDRRTNLYFLTQIPISNQAAEVENQRIEIIQNQEKVNNYQTIISVMTVATLLATAMAGRMEERKISYKVSLMRADLKNDESMIIGEVDKFSLLIITCALLIAVAALVFVLWV